MAKNEFNNISCKPTTYRRFMVLRAKEGGDKTALLVKLLDNYERMKTLGRRPTEEERAKWDGAGGG